MNDHDDELPPSEAARERRHDHDAAAASRAGMKSGLAKQFKQILDTQVKRGREAARKLPHGDAGEDWEPERDRQEPRQRAGRRKP